MCVPFADGGGGVAGSVEGIGLVAHFVGQVSHLHGINERQTGNHTSMKNLTSAIPPALSQTGP